MRSLNTELREQNNLQGFPGKIIQPGSAIQPKGNMLTLYESGWGFLARGRTLFPQKLYSHPVPNIVSGRQSALAGLCRLCAFKQNAYPTSQNV